MARWIDRHLAEKKRLLQEQPWPAEPTVPRFVMKTRRAAAGPVVYPEPSGELAGSFRGMHWSASDHPAHPNYPWFLDWLRRAKIAYVKIVTDGGGRPGGVGDSGLQVAKDIIARGMIPIDRFYKPGGHIWTDANSYAVEAFVAAGGQYVETQNEIDLALEWPGETLPHDWLERGFENWLNHARIIEQLGGIALTPALASGVFGPREGAGQLTVNPYRWIAEAGLKRVGCAIHNYCLNHPADYPYDPVNQEGVPLSQADYYRYGGPAVWDNRGPLEVSAERLANRNPGDTIDDDDSCFLAVLKFRELLDEAGLTWVPVLTTEGGPVWTDMADGRYPRVMWPYYQELLAAELAWARAHPWYKCICLWLIANSCMGGTGGWYSNQLFHPGDPDADSDGFLPPIKWLIARPLAEDGNMTNQPPVEPPVEPPPVVTPAVPIAEPTRWGLAAWDPAQLVRDMPAPGEVYWHLVEARPGADNMANTLWFKVEGVKPDGTLPDGARIMMHNADGSTVALPTKAPPDMIDQPMWKNDVRSFWVEDNLGRKSDKVENIRGDIVGLPPGVNAYHIPRIFSIGLRTALGAITPPLPPPVTPPTGTTSTTVLVFGELSVTTTDGKIVGYNVRLQPN